MEDSYLRLETELAHVLSGLETEQTQFPATEGKWSVQQIVVHLLLTYHSTYGIIQQRIEKRSPTKASPTLPQRIAQFGVITLGRFPAGHPAPAVVTPADELSPKDGSELQKDVRVALDRLREQSRTANDLFGDRRFASHMVLGPLSASQWARFHLIHGRHHLAQIKAHLRAQKL